MFKYTRYHLIYDQPGLEYVILGGLIVGSIKSSRIIWN